MSDLREAAQQALDALAGYRREMDLIRGESYMHGQPCDAEIALRAALEQAEPEPVAWMCPEDPERETAFNWRPGHCENCGKQRIPLYTALVQDQDWELSAALGWPGGISDPVLDRKTLLQQVLRAALDRKTLLQQVARLVERAHGIGEEV